MGPHWVLFASSGPEEAKRRNRPEPRTQRGQAVFRAAFLTGLSRQWPRAVPNCGVCWRKKSRPSQVLEEFVPGFGRGRPKSENRSANLYSFDL